MEGKMFEGIIQGTIRRECLDSDTGHQCPLFKRMHLVMPKQRLYICRRMRGQGKQSNSRDDHVHHSYTLGVATAYINVQNS